MKNPIDLCRMICFAVTVIALGCSANPESETSEAVLQESSPRSQEIDDPYGNRDPDPMNREANLQRLFADLKNDDWELNLRAATAIPFHAALEYRPSIPSLIDLLSSKHDTLQLAAIKGLSGLAANASDKSIELSEIGAAVPLIIGILQSDAPNETRRWAVIAMEDFAENLGADALANILPVFIDAMGDRSDDVSQTAINAIGNFGADAESAIPMLVLQAETSNGKALNIANALGEIGRQPEICVPVLIELLRKRNGRDRFDASEQIAKSLGKFGKDAESAVPLLVPLLKDRSEHLQSATAFALGKIGLADPSVVDGLEAAFQGARLESLGLYVRLSSLAALCALGPKGRERAIALGRDIQEFELAAYDWLVSDSAQLFEVVARFPKLTRLQLEDSGLNGQQLAPLTGMSQLTELVLPENTKDEGLSFIAGLANLQSLSLARSTGFSSEGTFMSDVGLKHISGLHNLRRLSLRLDVSEDALEMLGGLTKLESLGLRIIHDEHLRHLPEFPLLEELTVATDGITDAAMTHIAHLGGLKSLQLWATSVGDDGVKELPKNHPHLEKLNLSGTRITAACVDDLSKLKNLKELFVCFTPLAGNRDVFDMSQTEAVQKLVKALPNCRVIWAD